MKNLRLAGPTHCDGCSSGIDRNLMLLDIKEGDEKVTWVCACTHKTTFSIVDDSKAIKPSKSGEKPKVVKKTTKVKKVKKTRK